MLCFVLLFCSASFLLQCRQVLLGPNADLLSARPHSYRYKLLRPGRSGVVFGDYSPAWKSMKRGMMTSMKMFGEGMQEIIQIYSAVPFALCQNWGWRHNCLLGPFSSSQSVTVSLCRKIFQFCLVRK